MIVQCPRCSARYRVEDEVLRDEPTFKCSRCSHIFAFEGGAESVPAPAVIRPPAEEPKRSAARDRDRESLSFDFAEPPAPHPEPAPQAASPDDAEDSPEEEFVFRDDDEDEEDPTIEDPEPPQADDEPRFVRGEDELRVEEDSQARPDRAYLIFLALLALLYGNLALYLRNHPAEASQLFARIPVAGRLLTEDRLLQAKIHLEDIEGVYQTIKDDRQVFIISGRAVNASQKSLKGIQIESSLFDAAGKPVETKSIYCGNAMSLKIVKDLSSKEISLLQRLEPPQRFEIQPGESAGFTVVFMNPPQGLKEFSARVVAAQRVIS